MYFVLFDDWKPYHELNKQCLTVSIYTFIIIVTNNQLYGMSSAQFSFQSFCGCVPVCAVCVKCNNITPVSFLSASLPHRSRWHLGWPNTNSLLTLAAIASRELFIHVVRFAQTFHPNLNIRFNVQVETAVQQRESKPTWRVVLYCVLCAVFTGKTYIFPLDIFLSLVGVCCFVFIEQNVASITHVRSFIPIGWQLSARRFLVMNKWIRSESEITH